MRIETQSLPTQLLVNGCFHIITDKDYPDEHEIQRIVRTIGWILHDDDKGYSPLLECEIRASKCPVDFSLTITVSIKYDLTSSVETVDRSIISTALLVEFV